MPRELRRHWSYDTDIVRVTQMYDELLESYCVDERRVFASGHSSGAQLIVQILREDHVTDAQHLRFGAVVPVAASDYSEVTGCQSGATSVSPGCVIYDACAAPTIWCSHDDPAYGGTMHGVPCFAVTAMHDFFESLM